MLFGFAEWLSPLSLSGPHPIHISRQECDAAFMAEHMVDRLRALGLQGKASATAQVDTLRI